MAEQLDEQACDVVGDFFQIFAHATRMRIFCALQHGDRTVSQIAEHAGISLPNASQHLRVMRDKGAVVARKQGQTVFYHVGDPRFLQAANLIRQALLDHLQQQAHVRSTVLNEPRT